MNYIAALEASKLVKEIEQNNADMHILENAIKNGIMGAQITIACKDGTYKTTVYENERIDLLAQVLYEQNAKLMRKLKEL